jgi:hypothetical protein
VLEGTCKHVGLALQDSRQTSSAGLVRDHVHLKAQLSEKTQALGQRQGQVVEAVARRECHRDLQRRLGCCGRQ